MPAYADKPLPRATEPTERILAMTRVRQLGDQLFALACRTAAWIVIVISMALVMVLFRQAWPAIHSIGVSFFTTIKWDPEPTHREFGALAFIYGTVATSAIAMVIAVPLGVGTAVFLSEIAPAWLRRTGSFLVEMLAAIPSVVYGFWGLFVLAPWLQSIMTLLGGPNQGGVGVFPAGIILSIMIVPYVAAVSFDACRAVPDAQRAGAMALGATRWQTIVGVVLPYARPGIFGGCFLALGRALGETMAVTMLIGNKTDISVSLFALGNSIPSVIANEFTEATYDLYLAALVELGLVLLLVSIAVNSAARCLIWRIGRPARRAGFLSTLPALVPSEHVNRAMTGVLGMCLAVTVGFLLFILGYLLVQGVTALNWAFFTSLPAPVGEAGGGMANALYGSFLLVILASALAMPVGMFAAVYLAEYRSARLGRIVRFIGELLAGVPSIVIGIFAYYLVVKPMGHFSGWAGGFALGVMMIPIVMRGTEEALRLVPASLRVASHALGANHSQTVLRVVLPAAFPAIVTTVFLAIARVVGETAPLILTAFNNSHWPRSPNDATPSLPYFIFNYAVSPYEDWHRQAWAAALVLVTIVMLLNFGVRLLTGRGAVSTRQAG